MARPKKVSMQTIADDLRISKNAVSLALSGKKGVSEEVRDSVIKRAGELGYGETQTVKETKETKERKEPSNILVLVPDRVMRYEDNEHFHFFHDLLWGLEAAVRQKGCNAVIAKIDEEMEEKGVLPGIFDISHIGVILFGIISKGYARKVWELQTPLVVLDSFYRDLPCAVAASANLDGACMAVNHLLDSGHTRIGFIGTANLTTSQEDRWFGYFKAMTARRLYPKFEDCLLYSEGFQFTREEIIAFLDKLGDDVPTAFFCGNDRIALILSELLRERGYEVPKRVSIMGFDDIKLSAAAAPALSTMRVDKKGMAEAAVELLLSPAGAARNRVYAGTMPALVVRESTDAPYRE